MRFALLACGMLLAVPASGETYSVSLGGKMLGQLSYTQSGGTATLRSTLDNTPLGVFNGTFTGTSTGTGTGTGTDASTTFTGNSRSSRKQRVVTVDFAKGRAVGALVTPMDEMTDLSDIARVPDGVMDPVRAMGQLFRAKGCPAPVQMYDGRRVVTMRSDAGTQAGDILTCRVNYKVIAGPGHLSPLGISSAELHLSYGMSDGQALQQIKVSSGIFSITLDRQE
jgi:hypothetical protein